MAGGKLSPRQKMINMMYLVLTAMLALNVSKDILKALTKLNDSLVETIQTVEAKNADVYAALADAADKDPAKAKEWNDKALEVKQISSDIFKYIDGLQDSLVAVSGGFDDDGTTPKALDAKSQPARYLIAEGGPKKASDLKVKIDAFRTKLESIAKDDATISSNLKMVFATADVKEDDLVVSWEQSSFGEYPLGAILPFLTDIQARVRNSESNVLAYLSSQIGKGEVSFNSVNAMVNATTNYITQGGTYKAKVFLGAFDNTKAPKIIINGVELPASQIVNGMGEIEIPANAVGEQKWKGEIIIQTVDGPKSYPIDEQTFTVAPQSVVISPSAMNVLYRGVDNPLEIGVPGVDPNKVRVSGPGVSGSGGVYKADVTNLKGKEISISVSVEETDADGKTTVRPAGSKTFRIKGLPGAEGTIYKRNSGLFSKSAIANATIEAGFQDFVFDLPLKVTSFEVAIPGSPPERITGNRLTGAVKTKIERLKPGATVTIRNIKATAVGNPRVKLDRVATISVDVN
jgi:gliding motility-associated protein GldM